MSNWVPWEGGHMDWCIAALSICFIGQCEYSFTKTEQVMEMNRREMERYEMVYR